ncbi:Glutathione peroxidase [Exophiala mesophila]|uniref:Glutathione peroxidase n=1 Tax=Exophiala mesophila TaxID=212818 RepID=A0A438MWN6_EXOME|nr:Glutathione peroxidase [Exophiala mesophila]
MFTDRLLIQTARSRCGPSQVPVLSVILPRVLTSSPAAIRLIDRPRRNYTTSGLHPNHSSIMASATSFFTFTPKDKKSQDYPLSQHKGKVVLAVNTASKCGFTPQFQGLEALYQNMQKKYPDQFVILGFPCNQFGGQDPGSDDQIQEFCQVNYGVSFPVLGKTNVNGDKAEPVFEWLKNEKPGLLGLKRVKWNFEKFLVGKDGQVVQRYASTTKPESIEKDIVALLNKE